MAPEDISLALGRIEGRLEGIARDAAVAAHRTNDHAKRIQSLERTRHGFYFLFVPVQVIFGAIVAYVSRKFGA